jgi:hypothetical protein
LAACHWLGVASTEFLIDISNVQVENSKEHIHLHTLLLTETQNSGFWSSGYIHHRCRIRPQKRPIIIVTNLLDLVMRSNHNVWRAKFYRLPSGSTQYIPSGTFDKRHARMQRRDLMCVNLGIKLLEFRQLSWRERFSSSGLSSQFLETA